VGDASVLPGGMWYAEAGRFMETGEGLGAAGSGAAPRAAGYGAQCSRRVSGPQAEGAPGGLDCVA
jgi:hypothetical protein